MFSSNLVENVSTAYRTSFALHAVCGPLVNNENFASASLAVEGHFLEKREKELLHSCGECTRINSKMTDLRRWLSPRPRLYWVTRKQWRNSISSMASVLRLESIVRYLHDMDSSPLAYIYSKEPESVISFNKLTFFHAEINQWEVEDNFQLAYDWIKFVRKNVNKSKAVALLRSLL